MITFLFGDVKLKNSTVILDNVEHDGFAQRDAAGDFEITIDPADEPKEGEAVKLIIHSENDSEFVGSVTFKEGVLTFVNHNTTA